MSYLNGTTVLVTGAAGSIGSEIVAQLLKFTTARVIAFDSSEHGLYQLLRKWRPRDARLIGVLGSVTCTREIEQVFERLSPAFIFHAAAYKHVSLCEANPRAAHRVNVDGTTMVMHYAEHWGAQRVVLVSTDKAVEPRCYMGKTKREAERITKRYGQTVVRLGNVYGSSGSVIPLWREQIANGEPVTITDPLATRYMIGVDFAAKVILAAGEKAPGTYVAKLGEPIQLMDLAKQMGATRSEVIGLQPNEKMHEILTTGKLVETSTKGLYGEVL
jgi:UDP-N-acetylglucosamine 4,6-dehydratase